MNTASPSYRSPAARRARRLVASLAAALVPLLSSAQEPEVDAEPELVAEALFLCDTLPPGGRDLNLSLGLEQGEPDPVTGDVSFAASPRVQLAMALGERVGFTADVGIATNGVVLDSPGASLKVLLRDPTGGRTGFAASLDLFGSSHSLDESEAGVGLGAIRAVGRVALRASASVATGVSSWSPHLHGGFSAATALGARWRALAEVITDLSAGELAVAAGPTFKYTLGEKTALMAGALFPVSPTVGAPAFTIQLTRSL